MKTFNVGDAVVFDSRTGPLAAEYRGCQWGVDGKEACVIIREPGRPAEQLMVSFMQLRPAVQPSGDPSAACAPESPAT